MRPRLRSLLILVLLAVAGTAQEPSPGRTEPWPARYANTPEELIPFKRGMRPYYWYFKKPQPYRGPADKANPGGAEKSIRVGLLIPAQGSPDGARSLMVRRGVEMAFDEANARLGKQEPRREIVLKEDAPLWGSAATGMVDLAVRERVVAVIGSVDGEASHVALRVALKVGVFMVNTATCDPTLTETAIPWLLRCYPDGRQHAYRLACLMVKERGRRRIAVLRVNDRYGRMGIGELLDSIRRLGHPVLQEMRFEPGDSEFTTQVARIRSVRPDAVVLWGDAADLGRAARALRAGGISAPFFGPDRLVEPAFLKEAGEAAEGTTATYPYDPNRADPEWLGFKARFAQRFGPPPDHYAAYSYDGARILLSALAKCGSGRVRVRNELAALRSFKGVTGHMRFDQTHNNFSPLHIVKVKDGTFHFE